MAEEEDAAPFSIEDILAEELKLSRLEDKVCQKGEPMATKKQIAANRRNAKRSTGPRTSAGKARSAMNSASHGILGQFHLIAGEDPQEFSKFAEETRADLMPRGAVEESLVDRIIKDTWRLNRLDNIEAALLENLESLDELSIIELLNVLRFFHDESGRRFDKLPETLKFLMDTERYKITLAQNKLGPSSIKEPQLAGAEKVAILTEELASAEKFARLGVEPP